MHKAELLSWLQEEYRRLRDFLDQLGPTRIEQPGVAGHWSAKDIVAHLTQWERRNIARIRAALGGEPEPPPQWPASLQTDDEVNAWIYEHNHGRPLREILDESEQVFQQLLAVVADLPDDVVIEPAYHVVHLGGRRYSTSEMFDHFHDDHEADMRAWLARIEQA